MIRTILLFIAPLLLGSYDGPKIYEFRGPDRLGKFPDTKLLKTWPEEGPPELWSVGNIGNGFVSPVFTDNDFLISGETDSMLVLYCFRHDGSKLWQTTLGREWMKTYPGSRCPPTIADNLVYVGSGFGDLYCVRKDDGKVVWSKDHIKDFNGEVPMHGYSEAALVDGNLVFWTPGGKEHNVVALDRFTGKLVWSCKGFGEKAGYNSPRIITHNGKRMLVTFSSYHLMGIDPATGKLLWSHEQDNFPPEKRQPGNGDTHCNTVIYDNGYIYYSAGDGNCGVKLLLSADGTQVKEIWRNKRFDSYMGGILKFDDFLYGGGNASPSLLSINATTGILTDSLRVGTGALISADEMLYYYTQKGEMYLVKFDKGKFEKAGSFKIRKGNLQHFAHPVINKGILYQRHGNVLMAFDINKK